MAGGDQKNGKNTVSWGRKGSVVGRIMPLPSKDVHILIPRIYEYVASCGKKNFAVVIKDLEIGRVSWVIQVGPI